MNRDDVVKILKKLKDEVSRAYKADIKGIFGSCARDELAESSDIDVLVSFHAGTTLLDVSRLGDYLEEHLHRRVDLVSERAIRKEIEPFILQDMIAL